MNKVNIYFVALDWTISLGIGLITFASLETTGIYFGLGKCPCSSSSCVPALRTGSHSGHRPINPPGGDSLTRHVTPPNIFQLQGGCRQAALMLLNGEVDSFFLLSDHKTLSHLFLQEWPNAALPWQHVILAARPVFPDPLDKMLCIPATMHSPGTEDKLRAELGWQQLLKILKPRHFGNP